MAAVQLDADVLRDARNSPVIDHEERVVAGKRLHGKPRRDDRQMVVALPPEGELDETDVGAHAVRGASRAEQRDRPDA